MAGHSLASATNLIKSYAVGGLISNARKVFDEMPDKDVVAWTAMISCYTSRNDHDSAWDTFISMMRAGVRPNEFTISAATKTCKEMAPVLHGLAVRLGVDMQTYVENTLLDAYTDSNLLEARKVFDGIQEKSAASWATMIAGYTRQDRAWAGIEVFHLMMQDGVGLHPFTCSIGVRACASVGNLRLGKQLHAATTKSGHVSNLPVSNSLVDMHCRCLSLLEAEQFFKEMHKRDLITWNTIIAGFEKFDSRKTLRIYVDMVSGEIPPNSFTYTSVVSACGDLAILNCGEQVHCTVLLRGYNINHEIANSLIDMYAKCGCINNAEKIFDEMPFKDLVSWTSMITGYGINGNGKEAIEIFTKLIDSGTQPDNIVFMAVINACSHAGLVEEGLKYFEQMRTEYSVLPSKEVYGCAVDLLGRAGRITDAYELIKTMPFEPDESIWGALLGACKLYKDTSFGQLAAQKILKLKPGGAKTYTILSNIYASSFDWVKYADTMKVVRERGSKKESGRSWIEVKDKVCSFVAGDRSNPHTDLIYDMLEILVLQMDVQEEAVFSPV